MNTHKKVRNCILSIYSHVFINKIRFLIYIFFNLNYYKIGTPDFYTYPKIKSFKRIILE